MFLIRTQNERKRFIFHSTVQNYAINGIYAKNIIII